jgi:hypothetical protein
MDGLSTSRWCLIVLTACLPLISQSQVAIKPGKIDPAQVSGSVVTEYKGRTVAANLPAQTRTRQGQNVPINPNSELAPSKPAQAAAQSQGNDELAKRFFQAGVMQGLLDRPDLLRGFTNIMHAPDGATYKHEIGALSDRRQEEADARHRTTVTLEFGLPLNGETGQNLKSSSEILGSKEAQYQLAQRRSRDSNQMRAEMSTDQGNQNLKDVTGYVTDIAYRKKYGLPLTEREKEVCEYLDAARGESNFIPKTAGSAEAIMNGSPDLANMVQRAGLTIPEIRDVLSGRKTLAEIDEPKVEKNGGSFIVKITKNTLIENKIITPPGPQPSETQKIGNTIANVDQALGSYADIKAHKDSRDLQNVRKWEKQVDGALANPNVTAAQRKDLSTTRENLQKAQETEEKRLRLEQFESQMGDARATVGAATAVGGLIFANSPDFQRASQGAGAILNLSDGIGRMAINGFTDPTGMASVASGISILTTLMGPKGESADDVMIGMLKEILKTQQEILRQLGDLNHKADISDKKLDYIIGRLDNLDNTLRNNFSEVHDTLAWYAHESEKRNRANTVAILKRSDFSPAQTDIEELNSSSEATPGINKFRDCIAAPSVCTEGAENYFDRLNRDRITLRDAIATELIEDPYYIESSIYQKDERNYSPHFEADLEKKIGDPIEDRAGQIPSCASFLNTYQKIGGSLTYAPLDIVLQQKMSPYYLTAKAIPLYVDLVTHFPATYVSGVKDDLVTLEKEVAKIKDASDEMRSHADHVRMAFAFNAYILVAEADGKLDKLASRAHIAANAVESLDDTTADYTQHYKNFRNVYSPFDPYDPPVEVGQEAQRYRGYDTLYPDTDEKGELFYSSGFLSGEDFTEQGVMFSRLSDKQMRDYVHALTDAKFADLGTGVGAFSLFAHEVGDPIKLMLNEDRLVVFNLDRTDEILPTDATSAVREQTGLTDKSTYPIRHNTDQWLNTDVRKHPADARKFIQTLDSKDNTPDFISKQRGPWENLLVNYIKQQQMKVVKDFADEVNESPPTHDKNFTDQRKRFVQSRLALDDFLRGGYGECLDAEPALKPLRTILESATRVAQDFRDMAKASDVNKLIDLQIDAVSKILEIEKTPIPQIDPKQYTSGCHLGWGDIEGAEKALTRARDYVDVQLVRSY